MLLCEANDPKIEDDLEVAMHMQRSRPVHILRSKMPPRFWLPLLVAILALALGWQVPRALAAYTITRVDTNSIGYDSSVEVNSTGNPVISYHQRSSASLKLAVCSDITCGSGPVATTTVVSGFGGTNNSLELNGDKPVISYWHNFGWLGLVLCHDSLCSSKTNKILDQGFVADYNSLTLTAQGYPVISYNKSNDTALKIAVCLDALCNSTNIITADNSGTVGRFNSVGINGLGNPVVSYYHEDYYDSQNRMKRVLKVAACNNPTCSTGVISSTVDFDDAAFISDIGAHTSLAINGLGNPVISYIDFWQGDLKVATCGNPTCTSGNTIATVDSPNPAKIGEDTSIDINPVTGFPIVAYYDATNRDVKLVTCGNLTCTSGNSITTIDTADDVGAHNSLALTAQGKAVISYLDRTVEDLKLAVDMP
jgi:hypothetical protein